MSRRIILIWWHLALVTWSKSGMRAIPNIRACLLPELQQNSGWKVPKLDERYVFGFKSYYITKELEVEGSWNHYSHINRIDSLKVILFTIWYHLYNLKSVKNTHRRVFILKARNFNKSNTPPWVFFSFFKL